MNPEPWYVPVGRFLSHSFSTALGLISYSVTTALGCMLIALLVLCFLAWHRRDISFPTFAALLLVLSQGLRLSLMMGAFNPFLSPTLIQAFSLACLPLGASVLWWMAGYVLSVRLARTRMPVLFQIGTGILATLTPITAVMGSHWVDTLSAQHANHTLSFLQHVNLTDYAPFLALGAALCAAIACVIIVIAIVTTDLHHPILHHYQGHKPSAFFHARRPAPVAHTLEAAHRQIENRLATLNEVLEQQHHKNALLSHEMRTPLATISAAVQSLQMMLEGSDKQIDNRLQRIQRALSHITTLMDKLLIQDNSYDEALAPQRERVDLSQLAAEVAAAIQHDIAHPLQVEAPAPALAWCDGPLTGVMLSNLIHNAAKYSPANEPILIQVGTLATAKEHTAWITVTDHGPGIEKESQERIFDPHFRRAAHRETKGLGLGLYLVRKICERQGGTLNVESDPGQGARFTITVPGEK